MRTKNEIMTRKMKERLAFVWGMTSALLGVIVILVTLLAEEKYHPTKYPGELILRLFDHLGIGLLILGIVGIIVEFKNWRDYFEARLANIIRKKEFLRTLERDELKSLLKDVFQAYYKVSNLVYEDSFLEHFNTKIQDYIATPFREDTRALLTIHRAGANGCSVVEEDITYKCRKVDSEGSTIQNEICWSTEETDIVGSLEDYSVSLQCPEVLPETFPLPSDLKGLIDGKIVLEKTHVRLKNVDGRHGFRLSLEELKDIDELQVSEHVKYAIPPGRFFAWVMPYPSRGFQAVFHYPHEDFELIVETFGMDPNRLTIVKQPGVYSLTYDSWLLPDNGLAYQFRILTAQNSAPCEEVEPTSTAHSDSPQSPPAGPF